MLEPCSVRAGRPKIARSEILGRMSCHFRSKTVFCQHVPVCASAIVCSSCIASVLAEYINPHDFSISVEYMPPSEFESPDDEKEPAVYMVSSPTYSMVVRAVSNLNVSCRAQNPPSPTRRWKSTRLQQWKTLMGPFAAGSGSLLPSVAVPPVSMV